MESLKFSDAWEAMEFFFGEGFIKAAISSPHKSSNIYFKIIAEVILVKNKKTVQFSSYYENKVNHENFSLEESGGKFREILESGYKQWDIFCEKGNFKFLINKKGNFKLLENKNLPAVKEKPLFHNRQKNYLLREGEPLDMLVSLGVMNKEGKVLQDKQKKFRQINKFLEIISTVADNLPEKGNIVDFGCGKSYLTFALYYYVNVILDKNIRITGLDLKAEVVDNCNELAKKCGFSGLKFYCGDIKDFESGDTIDMMVTLHACDTATDYALNFAVSKAVKIIMSVPCCQHELFSQVKNEILNPLLKHGILKERFSALLTDSARAILLESKGYKVSVMEFIDMEHTPKNIMIRAVKTGNSERKEKLAEYEIMAKEYNISPTLYELLYGGGGE